MKLVVLVEGDTEKQTAADFMKRWLDPQLKQSVGIQVVRFEGYSKLTQKLVDRAKSHLNGPRNQEIIAVITLLDLYGPEFPGYVTTFKERYDWGVAHFQNAVHEPRFRMFFAVHEFEAWLLSQPDIFRV